MNLLGKKGGWGKNQFAVVTTSINFTAITKIADAGEGGFYEVAGKDFPRFFDRFTWQRAERLSRGSSRFSRTPRSPLPLQRIKLSLTPQSQAMQSPSR
jgi:hypothetical protein